MRIWIAILALVCSSAVIEAQSAIVEPELNDVFVGLSDGKLIPLERETSSIKAGGGGFIVVGTKAAYEFPGDRSPVRFHSGQPLDFVVRSMFATAPVDPSTLYVLRKLSPKKKTRELVIMAGHFTPMGGSARTNLTPGVLPSIFSKYGSSSFKLTTEALSPGEYAVSGANAQTVYCFGVD